MVREVWDRCNRWIDLSNAQHCTFKFHFCQLSIIGLNIKQNMAWKKNVDDCGLDDMKSHKQYNF